MKWRSDQLKAENGLVLVINQPVKGREWISTGYQPVKIEGIVTEIPLK